MLTKIEQLTTLQDEGFQVVGYTVLKGHQLTDDYLTKLLTDRKADLDYAIDGLVIEVNGVATRRRMNPTKETLNPEYAIKYKVADADNYAETEVINVEWNISKHGYLKPRLILKPVELVGVTVTHATGYNARYIKNNNIGPGTIVAISRCGDVVPNVIKVITSTIPHMPGMVPSQRNWDWDWTYNEDGEKVDAKLINVGNFGEVAIQQTLDFFTSIEAPHLKEGSIRKMFDDYTYPTAMKAINDMLALSEYDWKRVIGENGSKIYAGIRDKMTDIPLHVLMGSLPFFGRGVGKRKFKKLEVALGTKGLHNLYESNRSAIITVPGFSDKTVDKVLEGIDDYYEFYTKLPDYVSVAVMKDTTGGVLDGQKICFTGFRNPSLQQAVEENGGEVSTTVSGKTSFVVAKDPNSTSGKVKTARAKNIKIISIDDLEDMLSTD